MSEKNIRENRRKALKSIVTGGGVATLVGSMPQTWVRPVVNSISLPAHARTSDVMPVEVLIFSATGLTTIGQADSDSQTLFAEALEKVIPDAEAQAGGQFYACAIVSGATANVVIAGLVSRQVPGVARIRRGTLNLPAPDGPGGAGTLVSAGADISPCVSGMQNGGGNGGGFNGNVRPAEILSLSESELVVSVVTACDEVDGGCRSGLILSIPRAGACLPEPPVFPGPCAVNGGLQDA